MVGTSRKKYKDRVQHAKKKAFGRRSYSQLPKLRRGKLEPTRIPIVELPHLAYGPRKAGAGSAPGIGSGPGNPGDPLYPPLPEGDDKDAGDEPMDSIYEETEKRELIAYMKEELELDFIKPGKETVHKSLNFPSIVDFGDDSLLHLQSTLEAMYNRQVTERRQEKLRVYDPLMTLEQLCFDEPTEYLKRNMSSLRIIVDEKRVELTDLLKPDIQILKTAYESSHVPLKIDIKQDDMRYLLAKETFRKDKNAAVFFIRDVSWSISDEEMRLSYEMSELTTWWLEEFYTGVEVVYIAHNAQAWEESREGYYSLKSGGGTLFVPAYEIVRAMFDSDDYPKKTSSRRVIDPEKTDVYIVHMTDGYNFSEPASNYLKRNILDDITRFCYFEMDFWNGADTFGNEMKKELPEYIDRVIKIHKMTNLSEGVWPALKTFFGKKK